MKKLRLGLIGTGVAATQLYAPALAQCKSVRLVACVNRTRAKAFAFATRFEGVAVFESLAELALSGTCDGVILSLPIASQPAVVLEALRLGLPVLSEKPIAGNVSEAKKLITAANKFSSPWLVGENFAFMPHAKQFCRWVSSKRIGDVRLVEARQCTVMNAKNPYFRTPWRERPEHAHGFISDGGVHVARVLRNCLGEPKVLAQKCASFRPDLPPLDTALGLLEFESGVLGTWTSCFDARATAPMVRVIGNKGHAEFWYDRAHLVTATGKHVETRPKKNSFAVQFDHFADVVVRGRTSEATPQEALADLALIEALCGSKRKLPSRLIP